MSNLILESPMEDTEQFQNISGAAVVGGEDLITEGSTHGFAFGSVSTEEVGKPYTVITKAPMVLAKKAAVAIAKGEPIYWITATKDITNVVGANTLIGHSNRDALAGDTHVQINFDGRLAFVKL